MKKFCLLMALFILGFFQIAVGLETYEFVTMWGSCGSGNYQFGVDLGPRGLAVDNGSNLYVADYGNQKIKSFSKSGTFNYSFSPGYVSDIDYAGGYLYFTKPYGYACKYTVAGTKVWEKYFSAPGWNLNGICVDSDGNVHICNSYYNKVYKLNPGTGNLIKEYSVPEGCWQIASDNSGHLYIASGSGPVQRYTNDGVYDNSKLNLPPEERVGGIDVDDQGNIFIGTANYKMRKYDSNWNLLAEWGEQGSGQGQFSGIGGVIVDNQSFVYVSDGGGSSCTGMNRRIQVFKHSDVLEATITADPSIVLAKDVSAITIVVTYNGNPVSGANVLLSCSFGTFEPNNEHYVSGSTNGQGMFEVVWISSLLPIITDNLIEEQINCQVTYLGESIEKSICVTVMPTNSGNAVMDWFYWRQLIESYSDVEVDELWEDGDKYNPPAQQLCDGYLEYFLAYQALWTALGKRENGLENMDITHMDQDHANTLIWLEGVGFYDPDIAPVNSDILAAGSIQSDREASSIYANALIVEFDVIPDYRNGLKQLTAYLTWAKLLIGGVKNPGIVAEHSLLSIGKGWVRWQWGLKEFSYNEYLTYKGGIDLVSGVLKFDLTKQVTSLEELAALLQVGKGTLEIVGNEEGAEIFQGGESIVKIIIDLSEISTAHGKVSALCDNDVGGTRNLLVGCYPNPFNLLCKIEYSLPTDCQVRLSVYNVVGQKVKDLINEYQLAGHKTIEWDGKDDKGNGVATGVYFYRLEAGEFTQTKKMLLLK